MERLDQYEYFMGITLAVARRSACLSRQVGCILVDNSKHILATGFNGPPSGIQHCAVCARSHTDRGRDLYHCMAVHAEMNALMQCHDVTKIDTVYVTTSPCAVCKRLLANTPAQTVVVNDAYTLASMKEFEHFWLVELRRKNIIIMGQK